MKKNRGLVIAITVTFIIILATVIIKLSPDHSNNGEIKIINRIDDYGYILEDNKTGIHQKYFDELVEVLKVEDVNKEEYAKVISKIFVSDFYNLDNKINKNDIGGIQYIYPAAKDNMILKAKDTIYKYVENNIDGSRKQKLPIVSDVEIKSIQSKKFKYNDKTDNEAYEISLEWTYKEDLEYQNIATIILINEGNKLSIVELK